MDRPGNTEPPLPHLAQTDATDATNSGTLLFALDARLPRYVQPIKNETPRRSLFRTGTILIDTEGITFSGTGVIPSCVASCFGCLAGFVLTTLFIVRAVTQGKFTVHTFFNLIGFYVLTLVGRGIDFVITELRHVPHSTMLRWRDIIELQIAPDTKNAVLIYLVPNSSTRIDPPSERQKMALPLYSLPPAAIERVARRIKAHTPSGTVRRNVPLAEWRRLLKLVSHLKYTFPRA